MENATREQYSDAPTHSQNTCPASSSDTTSKPYRILPHQTPPSPYSDELPYRDDPPSSPAAAIQAETSPAYPPHHHITLPTPPYAFYTDASVPPTPNNNNDDVPLAHLHVHPTPLQLSAQEFYPLEAPPAYSVAIGQTHESSIAYYANYGVYIARQGRLMDSANEEASLEEGFDDAGHSVEKAVAMFVVATMLLVLSAVLGWLALGSGVFA